MLSEASAAEREGFLFCYVSFYRSFIILQRWALMGANFDRQKLILNKIFSQQYWSRGIG